MFPLKKLSKCFAPNIPMAPASALSKWMMYKLRPLARSTVVGVDGIGSLIMHWDNGSSLHVVYGEDEVEKI